mmetsp:Transcript_21686/g.61716  ORF Transcript_21686/g.61716 Transcript_21686/m.61716 type:complete len:479 (-) Transcript_21686:7-1443(-)
MLFRSLRGACGTWDCGAADPGTHTMPLSSRGLTPAKRRDGRAAGRGSGSEGLEGDAPHVVLRHLLPPHELVAVLVHRPALLCRLLDDPVRALHLGNLVGPKSRNHLLGGRRAAQGCRQAVRPLEGRVCALAERRDHRVEGVAEQRDWQARLAVAPRPRNGNLAAAVDERNPVGDPPLEDRLLGSHLEDGQQLVHVGELGHQVLLDGREVATHQAALGDGLVRGKGGPVELALGQVGKEANLARASRHGAGARLQQALLVGDDRPPDGAPGVARSPVANQLLAEGRVDSVGAHQQVEVCALRAALGALEVRRHAASSRLDFGQLSIEVDDSLGQARGENLLQLRPAHVRHRVPVRRGEPPRVASRVGQLGEPVRTRHLDVLCRGSGPQDVRREARVDRLQSRQPVWPQREPRARLRRQLWRPLKDLRLDANLAQRVAAGEPAEPAPNHAGAQGRGGGGEKEKEKERWRRQVLHQEAGHF